MSKDKNYRKSLKAPDRFQVAIARLFTWIASNRVIFFGSVAGILLIVGGLLAWQYFQDKNTVARQEELAAIEDQYQKEAEDIETKRTEIKEEIAKMTEVEPSKVGGKDSPAKVDDKAKAKTPKILELEKKSDALKVDHSKSKGMFEAYYAKHSDQPEGWLAAMRIVDINFQQDKPEDAKPILEKIIASAKDNRFYQTHARYLLINILADEKKFDEALVISEAYLKDVPKELKAQGLLLKARILIAQGKKEEAKQSIDELLKDYASSSEAQRAKSLRSFLLN